MSLFGVALHRALALSFLFTMGLGTGVGLTETAGLRRIDVLVPGIERDPETKARALADAEAGTPLVGEDPSGVGSVNAECFSEIVDRTGVFSTQSLGAAVHGLPANLVPFGHSVKRAQPRLSLVPKKSANLTDTQLPKSIGERFKSERKGLHLTLEWLEEVTGVPRTSIGRFEGGTRGVNSDGLLLVLAKAAERGVNLDYVFTGRRGVEDAVIKALGDPEILAGLRTLGATRGTGTL